MKINKMFQTRYIQRNECNLATLLAKNLKKCCVKIRLKGLSEFRGDFVALDFTLNKEKILNFYAQDFFQDKNRANSHSNGKNCKA